MKVSNINNSYKPSFGIFKQRIRKDSFVGHLDIIKGETKYSAIEVFKEYVRNKLDLKFIVARNKTTGKSKFKLIHYNNRGEIIYRRLFNKGAF